ncbi:hypothetical protein FEM48_Zijuj07G0014600 [Ziziphus jujuba var. spinosa]|uniref:Uncharacterized protein n=1 Tax=Ziziphus jujuba var. spinosa TaxID=714518 RepID=A0A978V1N1_ZIZJJ|nr:hypothetical protein FEM48_Zijuj07G0014600 [Ziziphus jujuba var. spinosa]
MFPVNCGNDGNDSETKSGNFVKKILGMCPRLLKQQNFMGETPLHVAAKYGNVFAVKLLIGQCVDHHVDSESGFCGVSKQMLLRMKNNAGDTALHESILMGLKLHKYTDQWSKHLKVAKILSTEAIEVMYDGNALGETPLYLAVKAGFHYVVRNGLVNMDAHATSTYYGGSDGKTILHEARFLHFIALQDDPHRPKDPNDAPRRPNLDSQAENSTENTEQEGRDPPPRSDDSRNPETSQESNLNPKTPSINEESAKLSDMANNAEAEKGDDAV